MGESSLYALADKALGGTLAARLVSYRKAGVSRRAARELLAQDLGVHIDATTIDRWMKRAQ